MLPLLHSMYIMPSHLVYCVSLINIMVLREIFFFFRDSNICICRTELVREKCASSVNSDAGATVESVSSEAGASVGSVKSDAGATVESVSSEAGASVGSVKSEAGARVSSDAGACVEAIQPLVEKLSELERLYAYLAWIKRVNHLW